MKILSILAASFFATTTFAAQINWEAGYFSSEFHGGTCYLVRMTSGSATLEDISNYIAGTGLSYSGSNFEKLSEKTMSSSSFGAFAEEGTTGVISPGAYSNLFVVAISSDLKSYAISSEFESITVNDVNPGSIAMGGWAVDAFSKYTGSVGAVPEPTVLALLALGVAGVALRRKKVVA